MLEGNPLDVIREWITVTKRSHTRVKLTRTVAAFEAEAALAQVEALAKAAQAVDEASGEAPVDIDAVFDACERLHKALVPFAAHENTNA